MSVEPTDLADGGFPVDAFAKSPPARRRGIFGKWGLAIVIASLAVKVGLIAGTGFRYRPLRPDAPTAGVALDGPALDAQLTQARRENRGLVTTLAGLAPRSTYIVVDRSNNRLYLKQGSSTVLEAVCSSGSGAILNEPDGNRQWIFDTPSGVFRVRSKTEDPAWRKPDWAFVEEGRPVPGNPGERIEYGTLGEYALHLGDGYMIHGTLYERLLGRSVTHGCIRLGSEDLRKVYQASAPGTPVYIF